jgi:hypothetical protein
LSVETEKTELISSSLNRIYDINSIFIAPKQTPKKETPVAQIKPKATPDAKNGKTVSNSFEFLYQIGA